MSAITILAIYGSILSTIVFLWDIIKYLHDKPCLKVEVGHHMLVGPGAKEHKIGITMANIGKRAITVVASGFKFDPPLIDGSMSTIYDPQLPKELNEGQGYTSYSNPTQIPQEQVVYGWVRDATGRIWLSKKWPLHSKK